MQKLLLVKRVKLATIYLYSVCWWVYRHTTASMAPC
jgi:hypothetical protein